MRRVALFVEDSAHQQIIGALVRRLAAEHGFDVQLDWRSAARGHGRVVQELGNYLRDLGRQEGSPPDLIVAATDANCKGFQQRLREIHSPRPAPAPMAYAIPDPHVERWLLLDGEAFKAVFGRGCRAPDRKCIRDRYKQVLVEEIRAAEVIPSLGGIEYAEDIVRHMDIDRAAQADRSFARFVKDVRDTFSDDQP